MIKKELVNIEQVLFRKTIPGFLVVLGFFEHAIPLGLGLVERSDVAAFGAFTVPLAMDGWRFSFDRVDVPLLDSHLLFENFLAQRKGADWNWQLAIAQQPVAMPALRVWLAERLYHWQMPRGLVVMQILPRTADGKLIAEQLREIYRKMGER